MVVELRSAILVESQGPKYPPYDICVASSTNPLGYLNLSINHLLRVMLFLALMKKITNNYFYQVPPPSPVATEGHTIEYPDHW